MPDAAVLQDTADAASSRKTVVTTSCSGRRGRESLRGAAWPAVMPGARCFVLMLHASLASLRRSQMPKSKADVRRAAAGDGRAGGTCPCASSAAVSPTTCSGVDVEFDVDGKRRTVKTDADGRAQISRSRSVARVKASTPSSTASGSSRRRSRSADRHSVRAGRHRSRSRDARARRRGARRRAAGQGHVVLGPESRIIVETRDDRLNIYYLLRSSTRARTPVDIGGPLIVRAAAAERAARRCSRVLEAGDGQRAARHRDRSVRAGRHARQRRVRAAVQRRRPRVSSSACRRRCSRSRVFDAEDRRPGHCVAADSRASATITEQGQPLIVGSGAGADGRADA